MAVYYSEWDPFAAAWLRALISKGLIPDGEVDERSILDVSPDDIKGFRQCHFFSGIGGWAYALQLAGFDADREVWTGSCPCQPFSSAGKQKGADDERHLWPAFYRLIAERKPSIVFGEQVAGALGREWLAGVRADLEDSGYACGAADLCAAGVGAPHIRQRLYWCAVDMADACVERREGFDALLRQEARGRDARDISEAAGGGAGSFWDDAIWLTGADGKARRAKPGLPLLAHGVPARVGKLRAFGNAIVPPLAAEVIRAFMEVA